jgi:hypothetical protein
MGPKLRVRHEWVGRGGRLTSYDPPESGDKLLDFLAWFGSEGPSFPMSPLEGMSWAGNLGGVVVYRAGQFQVQLFIFPPGSHVPYHRHPNVDTVEIHVAGHYEFIVNGHPVIPLNHLHDRRGPVSRWWGRGVRVRPTDLHSLQVYGAGACFLSIQHWLNGEPTSVGLDWDGEPSNAGHRTALGR